MMCAQCFDVFSVIFIYFFLLFFDLILAFLTVYVYTPSVDFYCRLIAVCTSRQWMCMKGMGICFSFLPR